MKNAPNFAAWNLDTLAKFAEDAYVRMQEQKMALEQAQRDLKDAMVQLRKAMWENSK